MSQTVQDLLDQTRAQLDETNTANVTDNDIVQALNRAQRRATNITARKYQDLFWNSVIVSLQSGVREYDIPDDAFGRRIEKVEVLVGNVAYEVRRIDNHKRSQFITDSQVTRPYYYTLVKNKIQLYPKPDGANTLEIHYQDTPENLVIPQGRITSLDSTTTLTLDAVGSSLSVLVDKVTDGGYVNLVDYTTGAVKASMQICEIDEDTNQITFQASPARSTVLGKSTVGAIPADVEVDDYICLITGTAVPELPEAYTDYLIQYAVTEIRRRFGEPLQEELTHLQMLEKEIERMWVGREHSHRVRKANHYYASTLGSNLRRLLS